MCTPSLPQELKIDLMFALLGEISELQTGLQIFHIWAWDFDIQVKVP